MCQLYTKERFLYWDLRNFPYVLPHLEFPMNRLHMDKQLGSGAYGTVYKAQAFGIFDRESEEATIVAVKTIVPHADDMFFRALLMELKIMAYIGKHVNIVSLLGAVTENIEMREVYLVMEYCRYGNVHEFLNKNANAFESEVLGGGMSATVRTQRNELPSEAGSLGGSSHPTTGSPLYQNAWEMTTQASQQGVDLSEGEPLWRTNFQGDAEDSDLLEFNTTTLISWSLQMARGMAYLASKRVIHGDLATRNVLIGDCHVVKVADFGLARQVYQNPEYTKTQKNPLPIKWMAIESLTRMAFSSQSDVWAFGITLWEMFSLGETPYQGMQIGEEFVERLKTGYRMKRPPHCPRKVFAWMKKCWEADPNDRPTFDQLCAIFAEILTKKDINYANVFPEDDGEPTYGNI